MYAGIVSLVAMTDLHLQSLAIGIEEVNSSCVCLEQVRGLLDNSHQQVSGISLGQDLERDFVEGSQLLDLAFSLREGSGVLDGHCCAVGEPFQEPEIALLEGPRRPAISDVEHADGLVAPLQGDSQHTSESGAIELGRAAFPVRVVLDGQWLASQHHSSRETLSGPPARAGVVFTQVEAPHAGPFV